MIGEFEKTEIERLYRQGLGIRAIERETGLAYGTVWNHVQRIKGKHDLPELEPKGVSTCYNAKGEVTQRWVKKDNKAEQAQMAFISALEGMKDELPKADKVTLPQYFDKDLCSQYTITDFHLGLMVRAIERGEEWDLEIAEAVLLAWFKRAIDVSPASAVAILANIGDFLHFDGLEAVTPTNKHVLDAAGKYPELVRSSLRVFRKIVAMLLEKHGRVHIIMAEGNHDLASSAWLREALAMHYEDDNRVTVDTSAVPYYAFEWGDTAMFFHHGHKKKMKVLPEVFASVFSEIFGRTKYRYGNTGHLHHEDVKEDGTMRMEQHPTLAPNDSHANSGGWNSKRGAKVITYHKKYGEYCRFTIRPE